MCQYYLDSVKDKWLYFDPQLASELVNDQTDSCSTTEINVFGHVILAMELPLQILVDEIFGHITTSFALYVLVFEQWSCPDTFQTPRWSISLCKYLHIIEKLYINLVYLKFVAVWPSLVM